MTDMKSLKAGDTVYYRRAPDLASLMTKTRQPVVRECVLRQDFPQHPDLCSIAIKADEHGHFEVPWAWSENLHATREEAWQAMYEDVLRFRTCLDDLLDNINKQRALEKENG